MRGSSNNKEEINQENPMRVCFVFVNVTFFNQNSVFFSPLSCRERERQDTCRYDCV